MSFPLNVYLASIVSAFAVTLLTLPLWRKLCLHAGWVDDPGLRKIHDQPIPLAGGLAVMTGLLVPTLLGSIAVWWLRSHGGGPSIPPAPSVQSDTPAGPLDSYSAFLLSHGLNKRAVELAGILLGAFGMLVVGWLDDCKELRPRAKFSGQLAVAALVAATGTRITLFVPSVVFSFAITILWILTVVNAFNFMDNMNGLCAGLGAIGACWFAVVTAMAAQYLVALIAFLTLGALLGFLPYNFPRATSFLGDSGSHLVGYLLSVLAILPHFYTPLHPRRWAVLIPLVVLGVPLLDMAWVVLLRWRIKQPFYQGDTNHLSHRLVRRGLSRTAAVVWIWIAAAALGAAVCFW
jgi:UDP-GlcNAc:undecaprenyl-phosphate/decaprenyl-phosphate GlcNAc-1-phosphate transferase